MEDFSEDQRANALKFVNAFPSQNVDADPSQLGSSRPYFTVQELEGECLHVARRFLSGKLDHNI